MEDLAPPILTAIREVKWHLGSGKSMKEAFSCYLEDTHDAFSRELRRRWILKQQGTASPPLRLPLQHTFWELVERGCAGQPSLEALNALEVETEKAAQAELDAHIGALPFKVLLPLLFFQFPAYLMLLLGPIVRELNDRMTGAFVLALTFCSLAASGLTADQVFMRKMNRARTSSEITRLKSELDSLKVARRACKIQLSAGDLPSACYEALNFEVDWDILRSARASLIKLDKLCAESSRRLRVSVKLSASPALSSSCRRDVRAALTVLNYRHEERPDF